MNTNNLFSKIALMVHFIFFFDLLYFDCRFYILLFKKTKEFDLDEGKKAKKQTK